LERLRALDQIVFRLINVDLANLFFDLFMPWITEPRNFYLLFIIGGLVLAVKGGRRGRRALVLVLIAVLISDQSALILKNQLQRIRPCHIENAVRLLVGCSHSFAMPSAHAANIFSATMILSFLYKKFSPLFLVIALSVAYSRVYVGVHYPSDVLAGSCLGIFLAFLLLLMEREMFRMKVILPNIFEKRQWGEKD
jgi:undecaprenyl-diphosphatase